MEKLSILRIDIVTSSTIWNHNMEKNINNFLVCVRCFTFNHSKYITDTLNGFTMQQTNFPFVCCVVDDASTDGEQDVIKKYVNTHFDTADKNIAYERVADYANIVYAQHNTNKNCYIAVLYLKYNHYQLRKDKFAYLTEWRDISKYEALCEGDDYWIDPLKLQKQVDFLEANSDYGMCYTKCKKIHYKTNRTILLSWGGKSESFEKLIISNTIPTLTVVMKSELYYRYCEQISPSSKKWMLGDYPIWLWLSLNSKIKFLDFISGIYGVLDESASHTLDLDKAIAFTKSSFLVRRHFIEKYNYIYPGCIDDDEISAIGTIYLMNGQRNLAHKELIKLKSKSFYSLVRILACQSGGLNRLFIYLRSRII